MPWKIRGHSLGTYKPPRKVSSFSPIHEGKSPKQLWNVIRRHLKNIPKVAKYKKVGRFVVYYN